MGTSTSKGYDDYDLSIDINKLSDAKEGWNIYCSNAFYQDIEKNPSKDIELKEVNHSYIKEKRVPKALFHEVDKFKGKTVVGVMGLFNRGKTFLLNKLAGTNLFSDKKIHTKGLSFSFPRNKKGQHMILLDTAGSNSPIQSMTDNDLVDKRSTELFLQDVIFEISDILIVVVNELTWPDQEFIHILYKRLQESNKSVKQLLIVHNYYHISSESELYYMVKKQICQNFKGEMRQMDIFKDNSTMARYFQNPNTTMLHFFLAKEGSPAGNTWNPKTIEVLNIKIKGKTVRERENMIQRIFTAMENNFVTYCKNIKNLKIVENAFGQKKQKKVTFSDTSIPDSVWDEIDKGYEKNEGKKVKTFYTLMAEGDVTLLAKSVDIDGNRVTLSKNMAVDFDPKFDVIEKDGLIIIVDLPGFCNPKDFQVELKKGYPPFVKISGSRKLTYIKKIENDKKFVEYDEEIKNSQNQARLPNSKHIFNRLATKKFEKRIEIPPHIDDTQKPKIYLKSGILQIMFKEKEEIKVNTDDIEID